MRVLGIDPGTAILGWGFFESDDRNDVVKSTVAYGAITTAKSMPMPDRLLEIKKAFIELLSKCKPDVVGIENLFFNKNVTTAITVAAARGVVIAESRFIGADVLEMTPSQVKDAVVGYGRAEKAQVQNMTKLLLGLAEIPKPDDAADALAIAFCTLQMAQFESKTKKIFKGK